MSAAPAATSAPTASASAGRGGSHRCAVPNRSTAPPKATTAISILTPTSLVIGRTEKNRDAIAAPTPMLAARTPRRVEPNASPPNVR